LSRRDRGPGSDGECVEDGLDAPDDDDLNPINQLSRISVFIKNYEMKIKEPCSFLQCYDWGQVIVVEGPSLKKKKDSNFPTDGYDEQWWAGYYD
jgi:hypothetical protein